MANVQATKKRSRKNVMTFEEFCWKIRVRIIKNPKTMSKVTQNLRLNKYHTTRDVPKKDRQSFIDKL